MKITPYPSLAILLFLACHSPATLDPQPMTATPVRLDQSDHALAAGTLLPLPDAEAILGQPAHLADSATTVENGVWAYQSTYTADAADPATGKLGNLYFMVERYERADSARAVYHTFKTGNADSEGMRILDKLGDEAYFHSDGDNFCIVIARKGDRLLRMKVNKLTSKTSLEAFHRVAGRVVEKL